MADIYTTKKRSKIMSNISGKETKPEIIVRKYLFSQGFRYLKNDKRYPGKPDIVLPKYKTIIFVHGCFWHGHDCKKGGLPETRKEFWEKKINGTKKRDIRNKEALEENGWNVLTIWECEILNKLDRVQRLEKLAQKIKKKNSFKN
ncbi:very short patch repair endonuclease [Gracilimonas amylolytica]|uniref:very short patch repair endonuclease n=1 Tax=Gracilimonas amylolytica TaxID=1749045 RepID=UPI000CD89B32|nr:DNA mismatch endonuclease Vsr [Gracilimonas amylolytica]